jgi:hypothetical protein
MSNKKAQITMILIVAFVILSAASIFFMLRSTTVEKTFEGEIEFVSKVPSAAKPIATFVGECIKAKTVPGLQLLGVQGGYIASARKTSSTDFGELTYGYFEKENYLPTLDEVSSQLGVYMDEAIKQCADFSRFEQQGFTIVPGKIATHVNINKDSVIFNVEYPLKISKGRSTSDIKDFRQIVKVHLYDILGHANGVVKNILNDPYNVDFSFLAATPYNVTVIPVGENDVAYFMLDDSSILNNEPYKFVFLAKHLHNKAPIFSVNKSYHLIDGQHFRLKLDGVDSDGHSIEFSDDTALFDISADGVIDVVPEIPGTYDVLITLRDSLGAVHKRKVEFVVKTKKGEILPKEKSIIPKIG